MITRSIVRDTYKETLEVLEARGWYQDPYSTTAGLSPTDMSLCLVQALGVAVANKLSMNRLSFEAEEVIQLSNYIYGELSTILGLPWDFNDNAIGFKDVAILISWNDSPARTYRDVKRLLERAMEIGQPVKEVEFEPISEPAVVPPAEPPAETPVEAPVEEPVPA